VLLWLYRRLDRLRQSARRRVWAPDLAAGRDGEDIAHRHLQRSGLLVIARNYRTPTGSAEVDLVAWDEGTLVFVEVKSRSSEEHGAPDRAVDEQKRRKILYAADEYIRRAGLEGASVRFDIVNVIFGPPISVTHFRDAFGGYN
jgi:putative endonuclease